MFWIRVVLCCICLPLPTPPPTLCPRFGGWESSAFFSTVWALKTRHRFVARSNLGWIAVMTVTMCHKQKTMNLSQHYFKPNANHSTLTQRPKPLKQPSGPSPSSCPSVTRSLLYTQLQLHHRILHVRVPIICFAPWPCDILYRTVQCIPTSRLRFLFESQMSRLEIWNLSLHRTDPRNANDHIMVHLFPCACWCCLLMWNVFLITCTWVATIRSSCWLHGPKPKWTPESEWHEARFMRCIFSCIARRCFGHP